MKETVSSGHEGEWTVRMENSAHTEPGGITSCRLPGRPTAELQRDGGVSLGTRLILDALQLGCGRESKYRVAKNQSDPRNRVREEGGRGGGRRGVVVGYGGGGGETGGGGGGRRESRETRRTAPPACLC